MDSQCIQQTLCYCWLGWNEVNDHSVFTIIKVRKRAIVYKSDLLCLSLKTVAYTYHSLQSIVKVCPSLYATPA